MFIFWLWVALAAAADSLVAAGPAVTSAAYPGSDYGGGGGLAVAPWGISVSVATGIACCGCDLVVLPGGWPRFSAFLLLLLLSRYATGASPLPQNICPMRLFWDNPMGRRSIGDRY